MPDNIPVVFPHLRKFGPEERRQRVRPTESREYIKNPHKGTATYQRFNGEATEPIDGRWCDSGPVVRPPWSGSLANPDYTDTTVAYLRWEWKKFERQPGERNWALLDEYLATAESRGQTIQFRFNTYETDYEDWWYWKTGAGRAPNGEPDINDELWYEYFGDLIRDFGTRYDGHPLLDTVDVAIGGKWGEGDCNATRETTEKFIDLYMDAFRTTKLMVLEGDYTLSYAASRRLGWRADCFGDLRQGPETGGGVPSGLAWNHQMDRYPFMLFKNGCQDNWKHSPVTYETCNHVGYWHKKCYDIDFIIDQAVMHHATYFMPKSNAFPAEWMDKLKNFNKRLGYRLIPRQLMLPLRVKRGENIQIEAWVDNVGCAPIYFHYNFVLRISQNGKAENMVFKADIRTWLPGQNFVKETLRMPTWITPGEARVDLGMIDKSGKPRVRFAITEVDSDGWHPVTGMLVVK